MDAALSGHVRRVHVVGPVRAGTPLSRFPDGSTSMLLRLLGDGVGDLSLAGPRTRALFKAAPPSELAVAVDFEPGSAPAFLGHSARSLSNRYVRIQDAWGDEGARLRDRLLAARSRDEIPRLLECALVDRVRRCPPTATTRLARRAVTRLSGVDAPRIASLAAELGVSERHLRRSFVDAVGVSPKEFARMARLQRALAPSRPDASWTERAIEAGYYDQAHFIADFRDLVGTTPARFERSPATAW